MKYRIEISNLKMAFPGESAILENINLNLIEGETLLILGRNGCGKSVLFKIIDALYYPDSGTVLVDNEDIHKLKGKELDHARMKFGFVFQKSGLFDSLTVGENVAFALHRFTKKKTG